MSAEKKKVTTTMNGQLHRKAKAMAALANKTLSDLLAEALIEKINRQELFKDFLNKAVPFTKTFLGDDLGAILVWEPGGFFHGSALYSEIKRNEQDVNFILLEEGNTLDSNLVCGRKVIIVSDSIHTGRSFEEVKRKLLSEFGVNEVKIVVSKDFSEEGKADFSLKKQSLAEHLKSLLALLARP